MHARIVLFPVAHATGLFRLAPAVRTHPPIISQALLALQFHHAQVPKF